MNTRTLARWLSLALLVVAVSAFAQMPIDIEIGYRLTNIGGNEDMYRTQINEKSGFLIARVLRTADHDSRAGSVFTRRVWRGWVPRGSRRSHDDETLSLVPGAGNGNNSAPVLGRDITASGITRTSHNSGSTPFTNAY